MRFFSTPIVLFVLLSQVVNAQDSLYIGPLGKPANFSITTALFINPGNPKASFYPAIGGNYSVPVRYKFFHLDFNVQCAPHRLLTPNYEYTTIFTNTIEDSLSYYGHVKITNYLGFTTFVNVSPTIYFRHLFVGINNKITMGYFYGDRTETDIEFRTHKTIRTTQDSLRAFNFDVLLFSGINVGYSFKRASIVLFCNPVMGNPEIGMQLRFQTRPKQVVVLKPR